MEIDYYRKYLKYKSKYLKLRRLENRSKNFGINKLVEMNIGLYDKKTLVLSGGNKDSIMFGFDNIGNSCYGNSILQCLRVIKNISDLFINNEYKIKNKINNIDDGDVKLLINYIPDKKNIKDKINKIYMMYEEYINIIKYQNNLSNKGNSYNPDKLMNYFIDIYFNGDRGIQQDASEFINYFLNFIYIFNSAILYTNTISLFKCDEIILSNNKEENNYLNLDMAKLINKKDLSLIDIMENNFNSKQEGYLCKYGRQCKECKGKSDTDTITVDKEIIFKEMPDVLIIRIEIMYVDWKNKFAKKITTPIKIPLTNFKPDKKTSYELTGICCHGGYVKFNNDNVNTGGHYISYVKNFDKWYYCSDLTVNEINNNKLDSIINGKENDNYTPYVLFYQKT